MYFSLQIRRNNFTRAFCIISSVVGMSVVPIGVTSLKFYQDLWRQKIIVHGLSCDVGCMTPFDIIPACDGQTVVRTPAITYTTLCSVV